MAQGPRESGKLIASLAKHVKIHQTGVEKLGKQIIEELKTNKLSPGNFSQYEKHPKSTDPWAVDWIFVADTLNFCFWKPEGQVGWTVDGYTGYFALCAALERARKDGVDITNPMYYSNITKEQLQHILRSDTEVAVPLFEERLKCLHEVGKVLIEQFSGSFKNCITLCGNSAVKLLKLILEHFPCFRDACTYKGKEVAFHKRAQILIGDIWACFNCKDYGHFDDIAEMTIFADYRVPQSLIYYGVMEYSEELNKILKNMEILEYGSEMEVEIRGCTIHAVELVNDWVKMNCDEDNRVNSVLIDHFLWDFRRKQADEILKMGIPFHKTLSIYY